MSSFDAQTSSIIEYDGFKSDSLLVTVGQNGSILELVLGVLFHYILRVDPPPEGNIKFIMIRPKYFQIDDLYNGIDH